MKPRRRWCTENREREGAAETTLGYEFSCVHWLREHKDVTEDLNSGQRTGQVI